MDFGQNALIRIQNEVGLISRFVFDGIDPQYSVEIKGQDPKRFRDCKFHRRRSRNSVIVGSLQINLGCLAVCQQGAMLGVA
jgi:hypothetical protein